MLYENYEQKVLRNYNILKTILAYKIAIIAVVSIVSLVMTGYSVTKGMVYDVTIPNVITFGEEVDINSKSIFSSTTYSYRQEGEDSWVSQVPLRPGIYEVQISTNQVFGGTKTVVHSFTIIPKTIEIDIDSINIPFGDNPQPVAELISGDYIDGISFSYQNPSLQQTIIQMEDIIIKDSLGNIVGDSYIPVFKEKEINFVPREITIKPLDASKVYDSTALTTTEIEILNGSLLEGHYIEMETSGTQSIVGLSMNAITSIHIYNGYEEEVTANYSVILEEGLLDVLSRPITIETATDTKEYDSINLVNENYSLTDGSLAEGHLSNVISSVEIINVGSLDNLLQFSITNSLGDDVTSNYDITIIEGLLNITPRLLIVETDSDEKEYDATDLIDEGYTIIDGELVSGHSSQTISNTAIKNAGETDNILAIEVLDSEDNDMTGNYDIVYQTGTLVVTKKPITIETSIATKVYDALGLSNTDYEIIEGTLIEEHVSSVISNSEITNVGSINNVLEVKIIDELDIDVTSNYEITYQEGTLDVTPREVTFGVINVSDIYNGNALTATSIEVIEGSLVTDQTVTFALLGSQTIAGVSASSIDTLEIWSDSSNTTSNYNITYVEGIIEVIPRSITIETSNGEKEYDGTYLTQHEHSVIIGDLVIGEISIVTLDSEQLNVGATSNTLEVMIQDSIGNDVTSSYDITYVVGELEVTPRIITILTVTDIGIYDGYNFNNNTYTITEGSIANEQIAEVTSNSIIMNVGITSNTLVLEITDSNSNDVTNNYQITYIEGTLEVLPRPITITTNDAYKIYDGSVLSQQEYTVSVGTLADNQTSEVETDTEIVNVSIVENALQVRILDDQDNETSDNYDITYINGSLEILPRLLIVKTDSDEKEYDATDLIDEGYTIIDGELVSGHSSQTISNTAIKNAGETDNILAIEVLDSEDNDMTGNYDIVYQTGTLVVTKKPITIETPDLSDVYNSEYLFAHGYTITEGALVFGHSSVVFNDTQILYVGTAINVLEVTIKDNDTTDVTSNYDITYLEGTLEVTSRPITIRPSDHIEVYDGAPLTSNGIIFDEGTRATGEGITITTNGSQTNVGISNNDITSVIIKDGGVDVTSNYTITLETSTLEVTPRPITIQPENDGKVYDATPITNSNIYFLDGDLAPNQTIEITTSGSQTNVGVSTNSILTVVIKAGNEDVTSNYAITLEDGSLEITPRPITVQATFAVKVYDETALTSNAVTVVVGTLVDGQLLSITTSGSQTEVGTSQNAITSSTIMDGLDDVTSNYEITHQEGSLEVIPRDITIKPYDDIKVYDGIALTNNTTDFVVGYISDDYSISITTSGSQTYVGTNINAITSVQIMKGDIDVTHKFNITLVTGELVITPRPITISPSDIIEEYDGAPLTSDEVTFEDGTTLAQGDDITITTDGSQTNVGINNNNAITNTTIMDGELDVTSNYSITLETGSLEVIPRPITIQPENLDREYNGMPLTSDYAIFIDGSLAPGQEIEIITNGSQTNVGINYNNEITSSLITASGIDVTSNYDITVVDGTLEVTPKQITIQPKDEEKVYDGVPLTSDTVYFTNGDLIAGHQIDFTSIGSQTEVGTSDSSITSHIITNGNEDVSYNYEVLYQDGDLLVTPRPITIETSDGFMIYDGTELYSQEYDVIEGFLVLDHQTELVDDTRIINVGSYDNILEIILVDSDGENVSHNYSISYQEGTLKIDPRPITIETASDSKVYDAEELYNQEFSLTGGTLVSGHFTELFSDTRITDVGKEINYLTIQILDSNNENQNNNYIIAYSEGELEITPRTISVESDSESKIYDGLELSNINYTITDGSLLTGHTSNVVIYPSIINVGLLENQLHLEIMNSEDVNVTSNYLIKYDYGDLEITPILIVIETFDGSKEYDGIEFYQQNYEIIEGSLLDNHTSRVDTDTRITNVDNVLNILGIVIEDQASDNVSLNYDFSYVYGTLEITPREISIDTASSSKEYDGSELFNHEYTIVQGTLVTGHTSTILSDTKEKNVGLFSNALYIIIQDSEFDNVSDNYHITYSDGTLEITPRYITIKPVNESKIYDAIPLTSNTVEVTSGSLVDGQAIEVAISGYQTNVGTSISTIDEGTLVIWNALEDVTENYVVTYEEGSLEVLTRHITIKPEDDTKIYDGFSLVSNTVEFIVGSVVDGQIITISTDGSQTTVGTSRNNITGVTIMQGEDDVTNNYFVTLEDGGLEVVLRPITIKPTDEMKIYDGSALFATNITYNSLDLAQNQTIDFELSGSRVNAGISTSSITSLSIWFDDIDVSSNYDIIYDTGLIEVIKRSITIKPEDATKVYDGTELTSNFVDFVDGNLVTNHTIEIITSGTQTEVGISNNPITNTIILDGEVDVTLNYDIGIQDGILDVKFREITIESSSSDKTYDGTPLTNNTWEISLGELFEGHVLEVIVSGSITDPGSIENAFSFIILDENTNDITSNYLVNEAFGTLQVNEIQLLIESSSASKEYDGTPLTSDSWQLLSGILLEGHQLQVEITGTITEPGITINTISYTIIDENDEDVASFYDAQESLGTLEIERLELTIGTSSATKNYDGLPLTSNEWELLSGILPEGHQLQVIVTGTITNAGNTDNSVTYQILDENNIDVSENYIVTEELGTLVVEPISITIRTGSASKNYDEIPLTNDEWELLSGVLSEGHQLQVTMTGSITEPGVTDNTFTYVVIDENNNEVTMNYQANEELGILEVVNITPTPITITTLSDSKVFDGTPLTNDAWEISLGELREGHELVVTVTGSITEPGKDFNSITYQILDSNQKDVSYYYVVVEDIGYLEVFEEFQLIKIMTEDDSKDYDGSPLTNDGWSVIDGGLLDGHSLEVNVSGTITDPGQAMNSFEVVITDSFNNDVTHLYTLNKVKGKLIVFDSEINGSNDNDDYDISSQGWFESDGDVSVVLFEIYSDLSDTVYLRDRSYGDYNKRGFDAPDIYVSPYGVNPLSFPGLAIQGNVAPQLLQMRALSLGLSYYLPYQAVDGFYSNLNDVYLSHPYGLGYNVNYIPVGGVDYNNYTLIGTEYELYEAEYRQHVYDTYLQVPESTRIALLEIAGRNGLSEDNENLIEDIKNYIKNAANYNLEFKPMPDNVDYTLYFLEESREGICQHFAMAATVMYRTLGIPARYVTGFTQTTAAGEWTDVTVEQAHAWVEVYIDGYGWVPQEVTAGGLEGSGSGGSSGTLPNSEDFDEELETITITSGNDSKEYDANPLTYDQYYTEGELEYGHSVLVDVTGSITNVGETENEFVVIIIDSQGNDVSDEYNVESKFGELVITPSNGLTTIEIQVFDNIEIYNGELHQHADDDYWISSSNLPDNYTLVANITGEITNVGITESYIEESSIRVYDENNKDVTNQFNFVTYKGSIKVLQKEITITLFTVQKAYDGYPLTSNVYYLTQGSLLEGNTLTLTTSGSITEVGMVTNSVSSVIIVNGNNEDITKNYKIKLEEGQLIVVSE